MMNRSLVKDAIDIFKTAVQSVDPYQSIQSYLQLENNILNIFTETGKRAIYDLNKYSRILVVGAGKATAFMAKAIEERLYSRIDKGHIVVKYGHSCKLKKIVETEAGHPIPDNNGLDGTRKIVELIGDANEDDLIICLLSGGASALMIQPAGNIQLKELQECTRLLLECGADIHELNTVRKEISKIKGGRLAKIAYPADVITLIVSDVVGDPLEDIGSGPTVPSKTTVYDALEIIVKYKLTKHIPATILDYFHLQEKRIKTTDVIHKIFNKVNNIIICNNAKALKAGMDQAQKCGYHTKILTSELTGNVRHISQEFARMAIDIQNKIHEIKPPACLISGGETTLKVSGDGLGGRNQEFALSCALEFRDMDNFVFLSCGTDGTDGPTDATGAFITENSIKKAKDIGIDANTYLENNDSYHFFEKVGGLIKTGPTGTNVMDIQILLTY